MDSRAFLFGLMANELPNIGGFARNVEIVGVVSFPLAGVEGQEEGLATFGSDSGGTSFSHLASRKVPKNAR